MVDRHIDELDRDFVAGLELLAVNPKDVLRRCGAVPSKSATHFHALSRKRIFVNCATCRIKVPLSCLPEASVSDFGTVEA